MTTRDIDRRSKWPAAQHLQHAADEIRQAAAELPDDISGSLDPMADWFDKTALDMAWLAPYRQHEPGYAPWRIATRAAHGVLGLPNPDTCPTCHARTPQPHLNDDSNAESKWT